MVTRPAKEYNMKELELNHAESKTTGRKDVPPFCVRIDDIFIIGVAVGLFVSGRTAGKAGFVH
ncbi:hypothetical protein J25TS5_04920 [Paenibacillus faecis]|uniref:hypothetical protein n=1 Tax=Paenibacillus faecis TaxID=862114 RepID=UPI001B268DE1|nr:hypothetical protein [Paenibacillus faecis]GIO83560.1 hypothetical protein J25TS5_04920 [Paenibacillus faecis]